MFLDVLLLFAILITLFIVVTVVAHIWIAVPFIPTPKHVGEEMLHFAGLQGSETLYDLGAGDARLLIYAKRKYPSITAIGVEFVPTVWLLGKVRIWISRQTVELRLKDVLKQDVSDADCIFLYLIPSLLTKLEKKFDAELKPGTKVVSYAFQFPHKKPVQEKSVPWLTGQRKLRMYVW
ncbi:SAM-dependent methyltransferase [Candidatus Peregrinibacteria bacterium CG10_big_fil_rev_8_21_14_0_10_49_10]|nr:MAG: SAM-dependent methyltransferase [Candidatus Peregrinibacteria bacterium CG10_big_fil_rev_8_21_14_0_10_49_10]